MMSNKNVQKILDTICFIANLITLSIMLVCTATQTTSPTLITAFLTMIFINVMFKD